MMSITIGQHIVLKFSFISRNGIYTVGGITNIYASCFCISISVCLNFECRIIHCLGTIQKFHAKG